MTPFTQLTIGATALYAASSFASPVPELLAHKIRMLQAYGEASRHCDQMISTAEKDECKKNGARFSKANETAIDGACVEVFKNPTGIANLSRKEQAIISSVCSPQKSRLQIKMSAPPKSMPCAIPLPKRDRGCEGEMCECRPESPAPAAKDFDLHAEMNLKSKVIGHIKKGESVEHEPWLEVISFGSAILTEVGLETTKRGFHKGDRITIHSYAGEGISNFCAGGEIFQNENALTDETTYKSGKTVEWYEIKLKNGINGFTPRENIDQSAPGCG